MEITIANEHRRMDTAEDASVLTEKLLANINSVTSLNFSGNTIGIEAACSIGSCLKNATNIVALHWNDMFTSRSKEEIAPALKALCTGIVESGCSLRELNLSDNAFGPHGFVGAIPLLESACCRTLSALRLDNEGLGDQGCQYVVTALMHCLDDCQRDGAKMELEVFSAGRNRLEDFGAKLFASFFVRFSSLKEVYVFQNGIGISGFKAIGTLLQSLELHLNLEVIDLSDNSLKASGIELLAKALPCWQNLKILKLNDCLVTDVGCSHLSKVFGLDKDHGGVVCPNLEILELQGNEIYGSAALLLVQALICSEIGRKHLKKLDLNCNIIGEVNIQSMSQLMMEEFGTDIFAGFSDDEGEGANDSEGSAKLESDEEDPSVDERKNGGTHCEFNFSSAMSDIMKKNNLFQGNDGSSVNTPNRQYTLFPSKLNSYVAPNFFSPSGDEIIQLEHYLKNSGVQCSLSERSLMVAVDGARQQNVLNQIPVECIVRKACQLLDKKDSPSDGLVKAAAQLVCSSYQLHHSRTMNSLLVEMRLLKSEEKNFAPACGNLKNIITLCKQFARMSAIDGQLSRSDLDILLGVLNNFKDRLLPLAEKQNAVGDLEQLVHGLKTLSV